jgi:Uma2 family endonuclease
MPMLIDERHLPAMLTTGPMTDDQFLELCMEHEDLRFELTADGELIIHPQPYSKTRRGTLRATGRLGQNGWPGIRQQL